MNRRSRQNLISALAITIGFGLVAVLSNFVESVRPSLPAGYEDQDLALQGSKLKDYSLGFNGLLADWHWMQALQYIGGKIVANKNSDVNLENLRPLNPKQLYPLLDNATDLDPQFDAAFSYGAVVLPAIDPEQAIKITEKGIRNNPAQWRLYQHLGFIYWRLGNYQKAAEAYRTGSAISGAPPFFKMMAAQMESEGGSRKTARSMYLQLRDEAQDDKTRELAELRLKQFDSLDERDALNAVLKSVLEKRGRCASGWPEILQLAKPIKLGDGRDFRVDREGRLADPTGIAYSFDPETCTVGLGPQSMIPKN